MSNPRKKRPHVILWLGVIILIVPCVILGAVLFSSLENANEPVVGSRFDHSLSTKITEADLENVRNVFDYENIDKIEVNLKSATLRILINTADSMSQEDIAWIVDNAYEKVNSILPIETYFTNNINGKMYDLEIHVYNVTDDQGQGTKIYYAKTKTGAASEAVTDIYSAPKNPEVSEGVLNPPVEEEVPAEGE